MARKIKVGNLEIKERMRKVYSWQCPHCGRVIESIYLKQLVALASSHLLKHEGKL